MGNLANWILGDDRKDLFEFLVALTLGVLFLGLAALLLWPLGKLALAVDLAKGYGILWVVLWVTTALAGFFHRLFRVNLYDRSTAYLASGLILGGLLQVSWSAFAALTVHGFVAEASFRTAAVSHLAGALSCLAAFFAVSSVYQGAIYKLVNLPLVLVSFLVFQRLAWNGRRAPWLVQAFLSGPGFEAWRVLPRGVSLRRAERGSSAGQKACGMHAAVRGQRGSPRALRHYVPQLEMAALACAQNVALIRRQIVEARRCSKAIRMGVLMDAEQRLA